MEGIIDFHTQTLPDKPADGAVAVPQRKGGTRVHPDGRVSSLPASTDRFPNHPREYILFGSDSPGNDQGRVLGLLKSPEPDAEQEETVLRHSALRLLDPAAIHTPSIAGPMRKNTE